MQSLYHDVYNYSVTSIVRIASITLVQANLFRKKAMTQFDKSVPPLTLHIKIRPCMRQLGLDELC